MGLAGKLSWAEIKAQVRWLYGTAHGFKRRILILTGVSTAASLLGVLSALMIKALIDVAVGVQRGHLPGMALFFVVMLAAEIALDAAHKILGTRARTMQANELQARLFRKFMAASWQDISKRHSGDYCCRMLSDVDAVNLFLLSSIPDIISTFAQLIAATWVLIHLEPWLAILALTVTPVFVLLSRIFAGPMREAAMKIQSLKGENLSLTQEAIASIVTIRAFEQQTETCEKLSHLQGSLLSWTMRRTRLSTLSGAIQAVSWNITYVLSLMWGILRLSKNDISYGSLAAYLQLVSQVQGPLRRLFSHIPQLISTSASILRLMEVLDMPEEDLEHASSVHSGPLGVTLEDVCFAYQDGQTVLDKVSMEVAPGAMTALVGPTGEGKSTIVRLLLGLVNPQSGSILLHKPEGVSYPVGACTRSAFAYVPQGNTALSGTIADNLRLAKPTASPEEMEAVLRQAYAWDFVSTLAAKMEARIGERGIGLSEGQQQRLAIARALLRDAPILILDEATSALDRKTEAQVLKSIQGALHGRTCLIITHRTTALRLCSRVYRLSGGTAYLCATRFKSIRTQFRVKRGRPHFAAAPAF